MKKIIKWSLGISFAALLIVSGAFLVWTQTARYAAFPEAAALAPSAQTAQGWYVFKPAPATELGIVFYPGGLVDPIAYAPLLKELSVQGNVQTIIVPMPLDLAFFSINKANEVIATYPNIKHWVIAGHSLGGSMAAEYVKNNPRAVEGLIYLGSYSADSTDLSNLPLKAISIYGTYDSGAQTISSPAAMSRLPPTAKLVLIDGGNHAQFGNYGPQKGDGTATISREQQQAQAVTVLVEFLKQFKN